MCGIVAYIGDKPAYPIILEGLKRLEYRGYDSAGVSILNDEIITIKINLLEIWVLVIQDGLRMVSLMMSMRIRMYLPVVDSRSYTMELLKITQS